jgi:hypothetical protein
LMMMFGRQEREFLPVTIEFDRRTDTRVWIVTTQIVPTPIRTRTTRVADVSDEPPELDREVCGGYGESYRKRLEGGRSRRF